MKGCAGAMSAGVAVDVASVGRLVSSHLGTIALIKAGCRVDEIESIEPWGDQIAWCAYGPNALVG